jgi:hypothetical protein
MRKLLITAFEDAVAQIKADAMMPLTRWNESVFRFFYSRAVATRAPDVTQFFECDRIDLVLHRKSERAWLSSTPTRSRLIGHTMPITVTVLALRVN